MSTNPWVLLATLGPVGRLRPAPGSWGSAAAVLIAAALVPLDWRWWLAAFVAFRLFDILKPGPVRLAENLPGGYGVMADDIVAGTLAAVCLLALQWVLA